MQQGANSRGKYGTDRNAQHGKTDGLWSIAREEVVPKISKTREKGAIDTWLPVTLDRWNECLSAGCKV